MTHGDDFVLGQRLRALRVDPPENGFEARLAQRLADEPPPAVPVRAPGRVIIGPWLRRRPARLIGATALLLAGAAAALEGGVVQWVATRVSTPPPAEIAPSLPPPVRPVERRSVARVATEVPHTPAQIEPPPSVPALDITRLAPPSITEHVVPRVEARPPRLAERRGAPEPRRELAPVVPRVEIEPRAGLAREDDTRQLRVTAETPRGGPRERRQDLERLRELAQTHRERAGAERSGDRGGPDRARVLDRLRERRDKTNVERRDMQFERGRRERPFR